MEEPSPALAKRTVSTKDVLNPLNNELGYHVEGSCFFFLQTKKKGKKKKR
jgi:hypothetical protein